MVLPVSQHLRLDTLQNTHSSHSPSIYSQSAGQHLSDFATPVSEHDAERPTYLSPARLYLAANARFAKPQSQDHHRRQVSASENNSPASSSSATTTVFSSHELRPWDRSSDLPSPLPSPISLLPGNGAALLDPDSRNRSGSVGCDDSRGGTVSPALSSGSKTDAFFATSYKSTLPTPPRPLHEKESGNTLGMSALGKGLPSSLNATPAGSPDRSTSSPHSRSNAFFATATSSPTPPHPLGSSSSSTQSPSWQQSHPQLRKSPLRSFTAPHPPSTEPYISPRPYPVSRLVSGEQSVAFGSTSSLTSISPTPTPPPTLLRLPSTTTSSKQESVQHPPSQNIMRRETTESMVSRDNVPILHEGEVIGEGSTSTARKWKLGHVLGEGAFSVVWSGRELVKRKGKETGDDDIEEGKLVAVKMMDKTMCRENDRTRISFVREVEVLRHISHPSVVPFLASFSTATHHCLVLEHLGGGELFDLVSQPANRARMLLPDSLNGDTEGYAFVRRIFGELCRAVGWLHEVGVVHRDIKLENLMLTANPFVLPPRPSGAIPIDLLPSPLIKLTDFGLSRFISPASPMLVTRCGSESFAAPEIIMGKQYDGRDTDSWAVGVVLYALVAGELPFDEGAAGTSVSPSQRTSGYGSEKEERRRRMMRIAKGEYQWRDGVGSAGVRSTVSRLLVRDPKRRTRVGPVLWDEPWMHGPGEVGRPEEFNGLASDEVLGRRRVLDGFLVDESRIDDVARAETA